MSDTGEKERELGMLESQCFPPATASWVLWSRVVWSRVVGFVVGFRVSCVSIFDTVE